MSVINSAIWADCTSNNGSYSGQQTVEHVAYASHVLGLLNLNGGPPTTVTWKRCISQQMTGLQRSFPEPDSHGIRKKKKASIGQVFIRFLTSDHRQRVSKDAILRRNLNSSGPRTDSKNTLHGSCAHLILYGLPLIESQQIVTRRDRENSIIVTKKGIFHQGKDFQIWSHNQTILKRDLIS